MISEIKTTKETNHKHKLNDLRNSMNEKQIRLNDTNQEKATLIG